jgi:hypothetical protein
VTDPRSPEPRTQAGKRVVESLYRLDEHNPRRLIAPIHWENAIVAIEMEAASSSDELRAAAQELVDALLELDNVATWSALGRPEYPRLRTAIDAYRAALHASRLDADLERE